MSINKEKLVADLKEKAKKESGVELNDEAINEYMELLEIAKLPVKFTDSDFQMGERELDIRELSSKNKKQVDFRLNVQKLALLKGINDTLVDILRVLCVVGKKLGIDDIEKELADYIDEQSQKIKKNLVG